MTTPENCRAPVIAMTMYPSRPRMPGASGPDSVRTPRASSDPRREPLACLRVLLGVEYVEQLEFVVQLAAQPASSITELQLQQQEPDNQGHHASADGLLDLSRLHGHGP